MDRDVSGSGSSVFNGLLAGAAVATFAFGPMVAGPVPELLAQTFVLRGTDIGGVPTDAEYLGFVGSIVSGVTGAENSGPLTVDDIVDYPQSFWPVSNGGFTDPTFDSSVATGTENLTSAVLSSGADDIVIFGYSQGAVVVSEFKAANPDPAQTVTYVLGSNPDRPNGGFLERFVGIRVPILDVTANGATPALGGTTYDVARQYEGWVDFPRYPLNLLSTLNAFLGIAFQHGVNNQIAQVDFTTLNDPARTDIVTDGQATYYTVPTNRLPLLIPLQFFIPSPILTAFDAPLRVMVEWGYDRGISPGAATPASLIRWANPIRDLINLAMAIPTGIDDGLAEAVGNPAYRPLGTAQAGMYGVGGRPPSTLQPALPAAPATAGTRADSTPPVAARATRAVARSTVSRANHGGPAANLRQPAGKAARAHTAAR